MDTETITASRFLFAFLGGLALNLTPCVYPLIPITISFFAGQAQQRVGRTAALAACYVLGLAITYSTLGLITSLTGGMLGAALQQPWILILTALVMAGLGLSLCGLFEFRVPAVFTSRLGTARTGVIGALIMGLTVGIVAAPCIGPFVLGMLLYVGQLGRPLVGFWLFFALALGLGLPYLFLGIFAGQLHRLPRSGAWLTWVKQLLGCVLFGVALYLVFPLIPDAVSRWAIVALLLGCGLYLGWVSRATLQGGWLWARRAVGVLLVLSAFSVRPSAAVSPSPIAWMPYTESALNGADGKPVLVDVYADWCIPCHEMDATTYRDPHVVEHAQAFAMVKFDATDVSAAEEAFIERYQVFGVPTLLAFDAHGRERRDLRRDGYVSAEELLGVMQALE
ncbi:MAG: thioredoxin fold domain-containing protein [Candidatus Omnitrophica bacterium]|nr:thioredoxin fold domain-containing protein [Candidatus Omnitrophota bacterium]